MNDMLTGLVNALNVGEKAAWSIATSMTKDILPSSDVFEAHAEALAMLHQGIKKGTLYAGWLRPKNDDIAEARDFAGLVRAGASKSTLAVPAWHMYRITGNPRTLMRLSAVLPWLSAGASWSNDVQAPPQAYIEETLMRAVACFNHGATIAGFTPFLRDIHVLQRLRQLAACTGKDALMERRVLCDELRRRMPTEDAPPRGTLRLPL